MRVLNYQQVEKLIAFSDVEYRGMIYIMFELGLRISELTLLRRDQIDVSAKTIYILGKRSKIRLVPCHARVWRVIAAQLKCNTDKYLFERYFGYPYGNRLVRQKVYDASNYAGLWGVHPHTLRHSRATTLIDTGCDLWHVKQLLGHSDIRTTASYLHYTVEGLRLALNLASAMKHRKK